MTKRDWATIKRDYVETTLTLAEVQAKWGVRRGTLSARATRQNWHDQKQQFAAKLEATLREVNLAERAAEQAKFKSYVAMVAKGQLMQLARQTQDGTADATTVLRRANALEKLQRIGATAFGIGG